MHSDRQGTRTQKAHYFETTKSGISSEQLSEHNPISIIKTKNITVSSSSGLSFLGHALHDKGLHIKTNFGTLVSSQQQRAAVASIINRGSIAGDVSQSVHIEFRLLVLAKSRPRQLCSVSQKARARLSAGRVDPLSRITRPSSAPPPRRVPPRLGSPVICTRFRFEKRLENIIKILTQLCHSRTLTISYIARQANLSNEKPEHISRRSIRDGAQRCDGSAGLGRTIRRI